MRQSGAAGVNGGPQNNTVSFDPEIGTSITRRRASSFVRNYKINFSLLTADEFEAFKTFFHNTLLDGVLPFAWQHPMTGASHRCKFKLAGENGYQETRRKNDRFDLEFDITVLESLADTPTNGPETPFMDLDFAWNDATSGDPGYGHILANDAILLDATAIHISKTGRNDEPLGSYIATWDDSTNTVKGHLRIVTTGDRAEFIEADVLGIIDHSTWYEITIDNSTLAAAGAPEDDAPMSVSFSRAGDAGGPVASIAGNAGKLLSVKGDESGTEWIAKELPSRSGNANKALHVKNDESDVEWRVPAGGSSENRIINPCFRINHESKTSVSDDQYTHDVHNILTQTGAVGVSTVTAIENGWSHALRITQSQVSAQRFAWSQMIENRDCIDLRGADVFFAARVRCSASTTLRFAILEWTGTADAIVSDVVSSWTSGTFTPGNFFLASNVTVAAIGSLAVTANTPANIELLGTIGNSLNNAVLIVWTDSAQAQNVTLDIGKLQFKKGTSVTPFEPRPFAVELARVQRLFATNFTLGTAPANNVMSPRFAGFAWSAGNVDTQAINFPVKMRIAPGSITFYSSTNGTPTAGQWQIYDGASAFQNATATSAGSVTDAQFNASLSGLTVTTRNAYICYGGWVADVRL